MRVYAVVLSEATCTRLGFYSHIHPKLGPELSKKQNKNLPDVINNKWAHSANEVRTKHFTSYK
jgi:hypothetical protein